MPTCDKLLRLNALVLPGEAYKFDPFQKDFCLTDVVLDLWSYPEGFDSKASSEIWLVTPGVSEVLLKFFVDKHGRRVNFHSGIVCPEGSYLSVSSGVFPSEKAGDLRVLMTGFFCW
jgi:hypothetical protein